MYVDPDGLKVRDTIERICKSIKEKYDRYKRNRAEEKEYRELKAKVYSCGAKTHNESSCNGTGKEHIEHKEYERDRNRLNELEGTAGQRIKACEYVAQKAAERRENRDRERHTYSTQYADDCTNAQYEYMIKTLHDLGYSKVYYEKEYNRIKNNVKDLMGIPYGKDLCRLQRN